VYTPPCQVARRASRILEAAEAGDLRRLEEELAQAAAARAGQPDRPPERAERLELLEAVAQAMREAIDRMRRRLIDHLEGAPVQLRLLRHLAAGRS